LLLAELVVRHTRRHMPTRRVALDGAYLPTTGPAHGSALLAAVVATNLPAIGDEQRELLPRLLHDARRGLIIPRIALRHRLQYDVHGLDRSRHRVLGESGHLVVELDVHGAPTPQVLGAVMGAAALHTSGRIAALDAIRSVVEGRWGGLAADVELRIVAESAWGGVRPPLASAGEWQPGGPPEELLWQGIGPDQRWAMEVLGLRAGMELGRDDVNRRFRRLLRDAHPDSGGASAGAAARISELTEARAILLRRVGDSSEESSRAAGDAVAAEG
jgi:hypothetical protein